MREQICKMGVVCTWVLLSRALGVRVAGTLEPRSLHAHADARRKGEQREAVIL